MKPERLARTVAYSDSWLRLYLDRVRMPGGEIIEDYHVLDSERDGVAAIVTDEANRLLLIRSYRYATDSLEWEIPAGAREPGESVPATAQREVMEETGYESSGHRLLYTYHPLNGMSNQVFHIVRCEAKKRVGKPDPNEVERVQWFGVDAVEAMLRNREIRDGFSLTALLLHLRADEPAPADSDG